ncbi:DUF4834 family protein [Nonlabens agnitus]|uniref:DUF4834 domain-containing protein n=1 Tax=Nonlabens agnitus TaxID=870484 RepID=A0A2S9WT15_9FLAO|nr:DUF4834 family protein [Nonlabens agnitus]PRP66590.1 hypothetical protein BST86_05480 [Nonlabens agnitus]PRP68448.1 hypothetical protein BST86_00020 [Nonlabens agnitus]
MKLLQAILIIVGVYLAVRLIVRMYGKSILKWAGKKAMDRVQRQFEQRQNDSSYQNTAKEGETIINNSNSTSRTHTQPSKKTVGEYVDYEEID